VKINLTLATANPSSQVVKVYLYRNCIPFANMLKAKMLKVVSED
jgi:hypothetical protein